MAGILMLVYASSFIDRQLLSLVIEPIRHDLKISDTLVGLLAGPAFVGLHVLALVPLGWLVDRWNRRNIIAVGAIVWTIMTAGCGLVGNYWTLFGMRAGVGSGEAAFSPSAYSLLSDYFPKAQLARALSVYGLGVPRGSSIAMIGGGWLIEAFNNTWNVGVAAAVIQRITPDRMRGRVSGMHIITGALIGLGIGPLAIGLGTDFVFARTNAVGLSLAMVATLFLGASAGLLMLARRPLRAYVPQIGRSDQL